MTITPDTTFCLPRLGAGSAGPILVGQKISVNPDAGAHDKGATREAWGLKTGLYTPRQLVEAFAPLLDTVVFRLGPDPSNARPARVQLLDNLAANLDITTREATLRLPDSGLDDSKREIADQARCIGQTLVGYARNHTGGSFDPDLYLRSPCEGHLLIPSNAELMFGPRTQSHLMQLFNEYMHQMVLLRDALLPFANFEDVVIPIDGHAARGLRHMEQSRMEFLTQLFTKQITQSAMIMHAQALLAPELRSSSSLTSHGARPGYGFHVIFDYRIQDYYLAPRVEIPVGTDKSSTTESDKYPLAGDLNTAAALGIHPSASIGVSPPHSTRPHHLLWSCVSVDLGQVARGHRYAYQAPVASDSETTHSERGATTSVLHDATSVLLASSDPDSLATAKNGGLHVIPVSDPIVALALLGKIYPENVVLLPASESLAKAEKAGKGLEPKFVVWGGMEHGGLRGKL
ncbi:hypothetical protein POX_b03144 [Penicillium oxalicum]|uniref:hypothetical protein n=1 Tax=Penicillium oxalicum TaxID=69781 RepID=UPI0020B8F5EF|nr:hypothetical protein POX_b03144 [Penicillium oxalicum]KAI2793096.1 hypothetical protein POX_b03144 [Penicillium oxalicum]